MKIFLAGTYSESKDIDILLQSPYILESFYYIKPWQYQLIQNAKEFVLDSGAFTFMQGKTSINWGEYVERYADFIKQLNVKYYFELDIDSIVGYERVKQIRRDLERITGRQCIPVWHKSRGIDDFKKMCDQYDRVAIGGIVSREILKSEYNVFPILIKEAHKRNAAIHGLGFTNVMLLPKYHFDSVDSTRWNCARFGRLEYFDGKTIKAIDKRKEGMRLVGRSNKDLVHTTFTEWIKFQKYADKFL